MECLFYKYTGYWCPGCGGTRAVQELLKGNVIKSILYNPFPVFVLILMTVITIRYIFARRRQTEPKLMSILVPGVYIITAFVLLSCTVKNLAIWLAKHP